MNESPRKRPSVELNRYVLFNELDALRVIKLLRLPRHFPSDLWRYVYTRIERVESTSNLVIATFNTTCTVCRKKRAVYLESCTTYSLTIKSDFVFLCSPKDRFGSTS